MKTIRELMNIIEESMAKVFSYDEAQMAELIGFISGPDLAEEWIDFFSSSIPNLVDDNMKKKSIDWINDWLYSHGIKNINLIDLSQDWDEEDNSSYKFQLAGIDISKLH